MSVVEEVMSDVNLFRPVKILAVVILIAAIGGMLPILLRNSLDFISLLLCAVQLFYGFKLYFAKSVSKIVLLLKVGIIYVVAFGIFMAYKNIGLFDQVYFVVFVSCAASLVLSIPLVLLLRKYSRMN